LCINYKRLRGRTVGASSWEHVTLTRKKDRKRRKNTKEVRAWLETSKSKRGDASIRESQERKKQQVKYKRGGFREANYDIRQEKQMRYRVVKARYLSWMGATKNTHGIG